MCVKSGGGICKLATSSHNVSLEALTAKESIVLIVDNDLQAQMTPGEKEWVEQVNTFLSK